MGFLYKPLNRQGENFEFPSKFPLYLKVNGSWPTDGDVNSLWYRFQDRLYLCWSWIVIVSVIFIVGAEAAYIVDNIMVVNIVVEALCPCGVVTMTLLRLIHVRYNMERLKRILGFFAEEIWIKKDTHPLIYERCIKRTLPPYYLLVSLWSVLIIYTIQPFANFFTTENYMSSNDKSFPYAVILPYDLQEFWNYIFTYILATFVGVVTLAQLYGMDSILAFSISFVSGQFDILHGSIVRLIPECYAEWMRRNGGELERNGGFDAPTNGGHLRILQDMYTKRLHELAVRHELLIRFCVELEKLLSVPLMITFVMSTLQICVNTLQFLVGGTNSFSDFLRFFLFFLYVTGQLYVMCNLGTVLITRSVNTSRYLFACNWEGGRISKNSPLLLQPDDMDLDELSLKLPLWRQLKYYPANTDFQHKLRLMIMRSHRPVQLTAMKFAALSLESFSRILSSSLSYFALLKSFIDKQNK